MSNIKRLERSRTDRMISGVCGGIARQFNFDTVVVRVVFIIVSLIPGMLGVAAIIYVAAIFLIPEEVETGAANTEHLGWRYDPWTGEQITRPAQGTSESLTTDTAPALVSPAASSDTLTAATDTKSTDSSHHRSM